MVRAHKVSPRHIRKWLPEWSYGWWWWWWCVRRWARDRLRLCISSLCPGEMKSWQQGCGRANDKMIPVCQSCLCHCQHSVQVMPTHTRQDTLGNCYYFCMWEEGWIDGLGTIFLILSSPFGQLKWDFVSRISSRVHTRLGWGNKMGFGIMLF